MPGVLIVEALAQMAGIAAGSAEDAARGGMLANVDVKFEAPVPPPVSIELRANVTRAMSGLRMCDVIASVSGHAVARGTIAIKFE